MSLDRKSLLAVFTRTPSWKVLAAYFFPEGPHCPFCSEKIRGERALASFYRFERVYCQYCRRRFPPSKGTPIHGTRWQPEEFTRYLFLKQSGIDDVVISELLDKSLDSIRDMSSRLDLTYPELRLRDMSIRGRQT